MGELNVRPTDPGVTLEGPKISRSRAKQIEEVNRAELKINAREAAIRRELSGKTVRRRKVLQLQSELVDLKNEKRELAKRRKKLDRRISGSVPQDPHETAAREKSKLKRLMMRELNE